MLLDFRVAPDEKTPIIELQGRFDVYEVSRVSSQIDYAIANLSPNIVINMAGVDFIDSTALATLVRSMKQCAERNGSFKLCNLQPTVRIIFELTRLDRVFDIFETEEEALAPVA